MVSDDILDLPARKRIYLHVRSYPGIHFREIQRGLGMHVGQLEFHLNEMVKREILIKDVKMGNARFFVRDRFTREERVVMGFLRKEVPRDIILFLNERPGSTPKQILYVFDFTGPNLSYHLGRLNKAGIIGYKVLGKERSYSLRDPDLVNTLLVMYRSTLFDKVRDRIS